MVTRKKYRNYSSDHHQGSTKVWLYLRIASVKIVGKSVVKTKSGISFLGKCCPTSGHLTDAFDCWGLTKLINLESLVLSFSWHETWLTIVGKLWTNLPGNHR
jgi:hypothetical protein